MCYVGSADYNCTSKWNMPGTVSSQGDLLCRMACPHVVKVSCPDQDSHRENACWGFAPVPDLLPGAAWDRTNWPGPNHICTTLAAEPWGQTCARAQKLLGFSWRRSYCASVLQRISPLYDPLQHHYEPRIWQTSYKVFFTKELELRIRRVIALVGSPRLGCPCICGHRGPSYRHPIVSNVDM